MRVIIILVFYCCNVSAFAQTDALPIKEIEESVFEEVFSYEKDTTPKEEVFMIVEQMPEFPGGELALIKYLTDNTVYPQEAREKNIQGRALVKFVVFRDGSVGNTEIVGAAHPLLAAEALRVVASFPKWKPGMQQGKEVNTQYAIPVIFKLQ